MIAPLVEAPGADHKVCPGGGEAVENNAEHIHPVGQVCIGVQDDVAPGSQHSRPDGPSLAPVGAVALQPDVGVEAVQHQFGHVVCAAVVHKDDLIVIRQLRQLDGYRAEGVQYNPAFVVRGYDQRYLHWRKSPPFSLQFHPIVYFFVWNVKEIPLDTGGKGVGVQ